MASGAGRYEGLTLGAVLEKEKAQSLGVNHRTLLDIIRQEEPNCRAYENLIDHHENKKGWKFFKDTRRPKRSLDGHAWAKGVPVRASEVTFHSERVATSNAMVIGAGSQSNQRPALAQLLRDRSAHVVEQVLEDDDSGEVPWAVSGEPQSLSQYLSRVGSSHQNDVDHEDSSHIEHVPVSDGPVSIVNSVSEMLSHNLSQMPSAEQSNEPVRTMRLSDALAAEREHLQMVVSSTDAARSARDEEVTQTNSHDEERDEIDAEAANEQQQVRMSLMDLLEDTDSRQIGWASYIGDAQDHTGNNDEGNEYGEEEGGNFVEQNCCVCMVRHKGSAFIPCGHTFCRLCSRELWVNRGNCPICNGFILEILDIF